MMRTLRMILNTFYSGPQAWFFLADDRGYFRDEGIALEFAEGDTAANAVPRVASGEFDVGYGDLNALIEQHAAGAGPAAAVGVFAMFNASPYTITVAADGPVRVPRDLEGRTLASHHNDAALRMLPEFARASGIDPDRLKIEITELRHKEVLPRVLANTGWDGAFGFVNTHRAAAIEAGIDAETSLRFFEFRDVLPDLYGSAVMVGSELAGAEPEMVAGLVRAVNRGLIDTIAEIDAAIDAVGRRVPGFDRAANRERLLGTLAIEMSHPDGARLGIGAIDESRFKRAIDLIVAAKRYPRAPKVHDVVTNRFLPALADRVRSLAR